MEIIDTDIADVKIIIPSVYGDERGFFVESFSATRYAKMLSLGDMSFVQDNMSMSDKGVLRGLHFQQPPFAQGKLVSVVQGSVFDVAVDIRKNSPTFGKHVSIILTAPRRNVHGNWSWAQFWVPPGFAHGFVALEDQTIFAYKCTNYYNAQSDGGVMWNDPDIAIKWPFAQNDITEPLISDKDAQHPTLDQLDTPFIF